MVSGKMIGSTVMEFTYLPTEKDTREPYLKEQSMVREFTIMSMATSTRALGKVIKNPATEFIHMHVRDFLINS